MDVNKNLRKDVDIVINNLIDSINPYDRTVECINSIKFNNGKNILVSIGKASWTMAKAVNDSINIDKGVVITKYNHSKGEINNIKVFEAGHPIVDENGIIATEYALDITKDLKENDNVILCISGGGSALFEKPLISLDELQDINNRLIKSGANINEINIIRKRLSSVKAGKFAKHCENAHIYAIILSDVVGDDIGSIASGPVSIDNHTSKEALDILIKYNIPISQEVKEQLYIETPKDIKNVDYHIIGSVKQLCLNAKEALERLGYDTEIIQDDCVDNVVDIAKRFEIILDNSTQNHAYIIGGESVVSVKGNGLGGRNTELALLCSKFIKDKDDVCLFTFGSDGTDGPTDAAGGYVDRYTYNDETDIYLNNNDSYHALEKTGGLIKTGPTGSNTNDIYVLLRK